MHVWTYATAFSCILLELGAPLVICGVLMGVVISETPVTENSKIPVRNLMRFLEKCTRMLILLIGFMEVWQQEFVLPALHQPFQDIAETPQGSEQTWAAEQPRVRNGDNNK